MSNRTAVEAVLEQWEQHLHCAFRRRRPPSSYDPLPLLGVAIRYRICTNYATRRCKLQSPGLEVRRRNLMRDAVGQANRSARGYCRRERKRRRKEEARRCVEWI